MKHTLQVDLALTVNNQWVIGTCSYPLCILIYKEIPFFS